MSWNSFLQEPRTWMLLRNFSSHISDLPITFPIWLQWATQEGGNTFCCGYLHPLCDTKLPIPLATVHSEKILDEYTIWINTRQFLPHNGHSGGTKGVLPSSLPFIWDWPLIWDFLLWMMGSKNIAKTCFYDPENQFFTHSLLQILHASGLCEIAPP